MDVSYNGGPCVNNRLYGASDTSEFAAIAESEKNVLATIGDSSAEIVYCDPEIFAQAFACLYTYPEKMMKKCPMLSAYIINIVNTYDRDRNPEDVVKEEPVS